MNWVVCYDCAEPVRVDLVVSQEGTAQGSVVKLSRCAACAEFDKRDARDRAARLNAEIGSELYAVGAFGG